MPAILATLLKSLPKILLSLFAQLITEKFLKEVIIMMLEYLVKKTATDIDDKILAAAKKNWNT